MNNKCVVGGIFCDLEKAFDCVNHNILLEKFQFYGIVGKFQALIKSYLSERYQKVFIDNINLSNSAATNWEEVKHGILQGSVLGPLFVLVYINDLPKITYTDTKILLYADDTSIIVTKPNLEDLKITVNKIFLDINKWFKTNLLSLNFKKIHCVQFRAKNCHDSNIKIGYNNKHITNTTSTTFLGLIIHDNLSWKNHIDHLISKLNSACCAVRTVKSIMSQKALRIIYFSYVHSIIIYGIIFWGNSPYSIKIFRIQKKIIRIITNSRSRDSCRELFKKLKILPLYSQYIFSLLLYIMNNKQLFMTNLEIHKISTRASADLHPPISNLTKFQKRVILFWNKNFQSSPI
jgi:hypothetical protein